MPDDTPDAELSHEPSIRFHCPSSRDSSMPRSNSSVAGSIAEDDLDEEVHDDDLEALRQVEEESPSPTYSRLQASTNLTKGGKVIDQDASSKTTDNGQDDPHNVARSGVGNSEHNPIQLDNDNRVQDVVVDQSDEEAPEVVSSLRVCDVVRPEQQVVPLPYGYISEPAAIHGQPNDFTANVGEDSDGFQVADMSDEDDLEYTDEESTDQVLRHHREQNKVYQSTYVEVDEEDEDASGSIGETEDEAVDPSQSALRKGNNGNIRKGLAHHLDTLQSNSYPDLLVDHTQYQIYGVPEAATSPILGSGHSSHGSLPLHDRAVPGLPKLSQRAPSPSDAAMAKTSSAKDSQLVLSPSARYIHGQNGARTVQDTHNDRPISVGNKTVTSTEDILYPTTRNPPLISYGTSPEYSITWQALTRDQTHYSDGPFRNDANRIPSSFGRVGSTPKPLAQDTASDTPNPRGEDAHLLDHESRVAGTCDRFFNEEGSRQPGHERLPADPYSHGPTNRLGSAMSFATPTNTRKFYDQPNSSPATNRATTGLSIGNIVVTESVQSPSTVLGTKRKADEISNDLEDESISSPYMSQFRGTESTLDDFSLPDAQPRDMSELVTQLKSTQSTESSLVPSRFDVTGATRDRRPTKRVKTIAKWIGTTILLGVSAVVTIAATAPQSVWDEIDREMGLA